MLKHFLKICIPYLIIKCEFFFLNVKKFALVLELDFKEENLKIMDYINSNRIKAFKWDLLRNFDLFAKLTKIVSETMEKVYGEVIMFFNLEKELMLDKK